MSDTPASVPAAATGRLCRRHVLGGAVTAGVAVPFLAACGGDASDSSDSDSGGSGSGEGEAPSSGEALATTADIEVGGGTIFGDAEVVVVQPTDGEFLGYTAICTHQGCVVASVEDGLIKCGCHGSEFSIEDGSVQGGPATGPLKEVPLTVDGDQITIA